MRDARAASGERAFGTSLQPSNRLAERRPVELVRLFLVPGESAPLSEDLELQSVGVPDRDGARPEPPHGAVAHAERDERIVLELAALDAVGEVGREPLHLVPHDEGREVQRMDAAVSENPGNAGLSGHEAPTGEVVGGVGEEAVGELRVDEPNPPEVAARDHGPHLADHRIARVDVVHRADPTGARSDRKKRLGILDRRRHWFLAQNVEARFEKCARNLEVRRIGGGDGHESDAIRLRPPPLAFEHRAPVAVRAIRRDSEPARVVAPTFGVDVDRPGREREPPVHACPHEVCVADDATFAAADEPPTESAH